ncbi:hypothetical protein CEQ90_19490 [Lewinellaceae bacterium SD302]|nr:hypothetical protein CEQ90_19490 [Lewinellaceae bacterium SD302]
MRRVYYINLLFLLATFVGLAAQSGELIRPLEFVTQLEDVHVDDSGIGWSGGSCETLLKTTDDGLLWQQVESPVAADVVSVSCAPSGCETAVIVAYNNGNFARSTDGGLNWTITNLEEEYPFLRRLEFITDDIVFGYSGGDSFLRSSDGGTSWAVTEIEGFQRASVELPTTARAYYFDDQGRCWKSENSAASWDSTGYTHPESVRHLTFYSGQQGYLLDANRDLYHTQNGGSSFDFVVNTTLPSNLIFFTALNSNDLRGVQVTDRVYESTDGGMNFTSYSIDLGDGVFIASNFHARGEEYWLASNMSEIYYSPADFQNWESQIPADRVDAVDIVFTDAQTGFYTDRSGMLFKSTDAGASWMEFQQLDFTSNRLYVSSAGQLLLASNGSESIQVSNDGGNTFEPYLPALVLAMYPDQYFQRYAELPGGRIYLVSGEVAIYSDDDGANWTGVDLSTLGIYPQNQLYFFDDNLGFMLANGGGRFARTTDGGLSWEDMIDVSPTSQPLNSVYFTDADNGIIFSSSRAYRTTDGGDSWTLDNSLPGASEYAITQDGRILTAAFESGNNGGAYISGDDGQNFSQFSYICSALRGATLTTDDQYFFGIGDGGVIMRYDLDLISSTRPVNRNTLNVSVFPNPANQLVTIKLPAPAHSNLSLTLTDLFGRAMNTSLFPQGSQTTNIEVSSLPAGVYLLNIRDESGAVMATNRLVVE